MSAYVSEGEVVSKSGYLRIISELVKHRKVKEAIVRLLVTAKQQKKMSKSKTVRAHCSTEKVTTFPVFVL